MATIPSYDYSAHHARREPLYPSYTSPSPYDDQPSTSHSLGRSRTLSKKSRPKPDYSSTFVSGADASLHPTSLFTDLSRTTSLPGSNSGVSYASTGTGTGSKRRADLDAPPDPTLSHPSWLRNALADQKRIWDSYNLLLEREGERAAARQASVQYGAQQTEEERGPFSTFTATLLDPERRIRRFSTEAYDRNRVIVGGDPSRYVNASYVREGAGGRWWVAAEAPTSAGAHAFLSMFLPPAASSRTSSPAHKHLSIPSSSSSPLSPIIPRIHTIVQLSPPTEGSAHPPDPYFPSVLSTTWTINPNRAEAEYASSELVPLRVQTVKQKRYPKAHCTKTTFIISRPSASSTGGSARGRNSPRSFHSHAQSWHGGAEDEEEEPRDSYEVQHLLFESWPAKSVPNSSSHGALRELMTLAHNTNLRAQSIGTGPGMTMGEFDPPIVVTCAEGGRTGCFIALASLLRSHKCIPSPYDSSHVAPRMPISPLGPAPIELERDGVLRELDHLLDQRPYMVDNEAQVRWLYTMLWEGIAGREWSEEDAYVPYPAPMKVVGRPYEDKGGGLVKRKSTKRGKLSVENVWHALTGRRV